VVQPVHGHARLSSLADVERFEAANCAARHFDLSAYHPAGTCRIGVNPATSVTGADHQLHDVPGLYVVDASSFPGSSGVNPQLTIMAMALRAADGMAKALSA
jgi:choline dehydrogenase-like flavoprotein